MTPSRPLTRRDLVAGVATLAVLLVVALGIALVAAPPEGFGPRSLQARDAVSVLLGGGDEMARIVVTRARLPRALLAAACGACLGLAGAILQLVLRNPLADPYVLGVSSGAALGAVVALALGASAAGAGHPVAAALGGGVAAVLVLGLGRDGEGRLEMSRVLLAGVVLSYLLSAGIMWVVSLAPAERAQHWLFWLMGSFASASGQAVASVLVALVLGSVLIATVAPALNLIAVAEEHASDAGVEVERTKLVGIGAAAILTGASVAAAGSIGFVGLVVPHSIRLVMGSDARLLLPASALGGASFLLLADTAVRVLGEVPVGVVTATCGAPFFLVLLWRRRTA